MYIEQENLTQSRQERQEKLLKIFASLRLGERTLFGSGLSKLGVSGFGHALPSAAGWKPPATPGESRFKTSSGGRF
ncbi:MAG: hypothetical protein DPW09_43970 [Anaerolineae bacterium]|nr:hypothetical protein [Anaerolineae bacterium]